MNKLLLIVLLFSLAACDETLPVQSLAWNIRAENCADLDAGLTLVRDLSRIGWCNVTGVPLVMTLDADNSEPDFLISIPDPIDPKPVNISAFSQMTDPYRDTWNHIAVRTHEAHDITIGQGVKLMVIDTGIVPHQDLPEPIDCLHTIGEDGCRDGHGHGTHVAGIIVMLVNNGYGGIGISPDSELGVCKALNDRGVGTMSSVAECILESSRLNYDVVNMSLGSNTPSKVIDDAIDYAASQGVTLVAACGNSGNKGGVICDHPARHNAVVSVGAIDANGNVPNWSNGKPDLVAPGVNILSTVKSNGYFEWSGTSMASPHVAAALGLLLSEQDINPDEIKDYVIGTTVGVEGCQAERCGNGALDILSMLSESPIPTPTPDPTPTSTPIPVGERCGISVAQVATWEDADRWWFFSGAGFLNWLGDNETLWSFLPFDLGDGYMHLSIAAENTEVCHAFRTLFEEAGYQVFGDN